MTLLYDWIRDENVQAWAGLINYLAVADCTDESYEAGDLLEELHEPGVEQEHDTVAVWDGNRLVGFAQMRVGQRLREGYSRVSIAGGVHPEYRRQGIGAKLMDIFEARALLKSSQLHPGVAVFVDMWGNEPGHSAGSLAESRGYLPARHFQDMSLRKQGFRKVSTKPESKGRQILLPYSLDWAEAVRLLDNEAFADHWGSTPKSADEWQAMTSARSFRAEHSRILVEPRAGGLQPSVLSYVLCSEWISKELYVGRVGTAREARRRGYATLLLSDIAATAFAGGFLEVGLSVDAESPTGAVGLYERLGFAVTRSGTMYRKELSPSASTA